jgi:hypothetical protein
VHGGGQALQHFVDDGTNGWGMTTTSFMAVSARASRGFRGKNPMIGGAHIERTATDWCAAQAPGSMHQRCIERVLVDQVSSADRAGFGWRVEPTKEKGFFILLMHFSFNIEVEIILGEILRDLIKLWKFSWRLIGIFGTTFVLGTLTKGQQNSNEKRNQIWS